MSAAWFMTIRKVASRAGTTAFAAMQRRRRYPQGVKLLPLEYSPVRKRAARGVGANSNARQYLVFFWQAVYDHSSCYPHSKRAVSARVPWGKHAAGAGVDHAAGGALFAGVSGNSGETCVSGSVQDSGPGSRSVAAAVPAAGGGCGNRFLRHFDPRGGNGIGAGTRRHRSEPAAASSNEGRRRKIEIVRSRIGNGISAGGDSPDCTRSWAGCARAGVRGGAVDPGELHG